MSAVEEVVTEAPAVEAVPKRAMTLGLGTSLVVLAALVIAPLFVKNFIIFQMTMLLIYALAVLALNILTGGSGQFSLGQSAFYAVGAYTSAILMEHVGMNYALTLPIAASSALASVSCSASRRCGLSGVYLALATFALAVAMPQLLKLGFFEHWTGGVQGLVVTKPDAPFGLPMSQDMWLYYFTLAIGIGIYIASVNLLRSRSGRAFMAIRDNEIAASAMGVDVALYKTLAFGVSAGITGVAGGLGAIAVQFVAPDGYTITLAISLFLGMVVGGVGWLPGSIVGSAFIIFVPNIAEGYLQRPLRRRIRRASVPRHLPRAARRKAGRDRRPATARQTEEVSRNSGETMRPAYTIHERRPPISGAAAQRLSLPQSRQCTRPEEIRHRRDRYRNQDRQHHALQRTRLRLWHDRQDRRSLLQDDQRRGRHQRPQDQLHQL